MDPLVTALVLLAAVLHASWNALVKRSGDSLLSIWCVTLAGGVFAGLFTPWVDFPPRAVWPWLAISVAVHWLYMLSLAQGYRIGHLNQVYPIARGLAPCVVAALAWILVDERLTPRQLAGLALVAGSLASLALTGGGLRGGAASAAASSAVRTGLLIGAYTYVDALGARGSHSPFDYIVWSFVLDAVPITATVLVVRRRRILPFLRSEVLYGLGGGLLATVAYGVVMWAMAQGPMAWIAALRETSVLFGAWMGSQLLREPFGMRRIVGGAGVALGLVVMRG